MNKFGTGMQRSFISNDFYVIWREARETWNRSTVRDSTWQNWATYTHTYGKDYARKHEREGNTKLTEPNFVWLARST